MDCEVLICGLGPVGQLLALLLGDLGVKVIAVDEANEPYDLPRAAVVDDEVLRIFQTAGVAEQILADAQAQRAITYVTARGRAMKVFRTEHGELGHPPLVSIHQPSMERTLVAALEHRGVVDLRWGTRVETLDRAAGHVTAWLRPAGGERAEPLRARYLIGCDGGRSAVRGQLEIPFGGSTFAQRWLVVDTLVDRPVAKVPHPHFIGDLRRPIVTLPMSPGRHRWEWMLHPGEDEAPFLDPARIRELLVSWLSGEQVEVERAVVYTFHARRAQRWRAGCVLLAGDAAHVMPPFVGQGFSSGARDVANLAWKLAAVVQGAPERLLDTYEAERHPHVRSMQNLAVRWGGVVQTTNPAVGLLRDASIELLDRSGALRWIGARAKPRPRYRRGAFARGGGKLFPQPDGLDEKLGRGWSVIASSAGAAAAWRAAGLHVVEHPHEREWTLLRPDRYVFADNDMPGALSALRAMLGTSPTRKAPTTMVTRMGHIGLRVPDLDAAVDFQRDVVGMVQTERTAGAAYLTCNERHHELVLIQDPARRGYDHIGLEVPDAAALEAAKRAVPAAGGRVLGDVYDGGPGIDRALRVQGPGGHVFKLFCGMQTGQVLEPGDRPIKFEHASIKAPRPGRVERFLRDGLGFRFSDRMGPFASWWHCDADHHGMAIVLAPKNELSHYAYALEDLSALGRVADRLKRHSDQKLIFGPSRHGPGNNLFAYFYDNDGAMIELCAELAQMPPHGDYQARKWPIDPSTINQWGGPPPLKFIRAGFPIVAA